MASDLVVSGSTRTASFAVSNPGVSCPDSMASTGAGSGGTASECLAVSDRWRALGLCIGANWSWAFGRGFGARVGGQRLRGPGGGGCQACVGPGIWGRLVLDPVVGEQLGLLFGAELVVEVDLGGVLDVALLVGDLEAVADLGRVDQGDEGLGRAEEAGVDQGPGGVAGLAVEVELLDRPDRRAVSVDDGERSPAVEGRRVEGRHGLPPCLHSPFDAEGPRPPSLPAERSRLTGQSRRTGGGYGTARSRAEPPGEPANPRRPGGTRPSVATSAEPRATLRATSGPPERASVGG